MIDFDSLVVGPATAIFGQAVTYTPAGGSPVTITGVFDSGAKEISGLGSDGVPISDNRPLLGVRTADFAALGIAPNQGDRISVAQPDGSSIAYQVADIDTDGQGATKLTLNQLVNQ
jgi:hypothetical protein